VLRDRWDVRGGIGRGAAYPIGSPPYDELRTIWNFYNQQQGANIPFLFFDPSDNTTRADPSVPMTFFFAVADGMTTSFQAVSPLLAPVVPAVINDITPRSMYVLDPLTGVITFNFRATPGPGTAIGMDMSYYYRVRFAEDNLSAENFAYQFWNMKQVKLVSVIE